MELSKQEAGLRDTAPLAALEGRSTLMAPLLSLIACSQSTACFYTAFPPKCRLHDDPFSVLTVSGVVERSKCSASAPLAQVQQRPHPPWQSAAAQAAAAPQQPGLKNRNLFALCLPLLDVCSTLLTELWPRCHSGDLAAVWGHMGPSVPTSTGSVALTGWLLILLLVSASMT